MVLYFLHVSFGSGLSLHFTSLRTEISLSYALSIPCFITSFNDFSSSINLTVGSSDPISGRKPSAPTIVGIVFLVEKCVTLSFISYLLLCNTILSIYLSIYLSI